jgi:hypothetical protein
MLQRFQRGNDRGEQEGGKREDHFSLSKHRPATPESFFGALRPRDLENGFANRLLVLPFEGSCRPPERFSSSRSSKPPKTLIEGLKRLPRLPSVLDVGTRNPIWFGAGADEVYLAFSKKMDDFENRDQMRYELGMRVCENAVRLATNVAVGRGSPTVDKEDIAWAIALSERSFDASCGGFNRYMQVYFEFPKFCDVVADAYCTEGWIAIRDIHRRFGRRQRFGTEVDRVLAQLVKEERIIKDDHPPPPTGGKSSPGHKWIKD